LLPLECLIVQRGSQPKYVLDIYPPIAYAPSLQIVKALALRESPQTVAEKATVLTVGDPAYGAVAAEGSPFARAGAQLPTLPYSGIEATWVADAFGKVGAPTVRLTGKSATEAGVRKQIAGRKIIHLACHGLVDSAYGNLFGSLILAPGTGHSSADDGFLMLPEIYQLDARSCELAILSACRTNSGPEQRGEGTWTLSRGFLVAGARRVVASTWLVDDEAAASLISYYASLVARSENGGTPAYARHLQTAKRWVRNQDKWRSPYFWGTFVLTGPN
jgi:CHAT domain-containing protein